MNNLKNYNVTEIDIKDTVLIEGGDSCWKRMGAKFKGFLCDVGDAFTSIKYTPQLA